MRNDEFKRQLRQLVRKELARMDLTAIVQEAVEDMNWRALVHDALHEQFNITNSTGPVQERVLH